MYFHQLGLCDQTWNIHIFVLIGTFQWNRRVHVPVIKKNCLWWYDAFLWWACKLSLSHRSAVISLPKYVFCRLDIITIQLRSYSSSGHQIKMEKLKRPTSCDQNIGGSGKKFVISIKNPLWSLSPTSAQGNIGFGAMQLPSKCVLFKG